MIFRDRHRSRFVVQLQSLAASSVHVEFLKSFGFFVSLLVGWLGGEYISWSGSIRGFCIRTDLESFGNMAIEGIIVSKLALQGL